MEKWQTMNLGQVLPEKIPDEMLEKLCKSRYLNRSLWFLYQMYDAFSDALTTFSLTDNHSAVAQFDMAVHSSTSREELLRLDETKLYNDLADEAKMITDASQSEDDRGNPHLHFGHLVSGYDAGYYGYLWCVFSNSVMGIMTC